uniref:Integrase zinc-binding domain-containing protein n=1 Tax=Parascaris univalens TaxID=6257 RepID=A0A915AWG3_PARUN
MQTMRGATSPTLADEAEWWQGPLRLINSEDEWPKIPSLPIHDIFRSGKKLPIAENSSTQMVTATPYPPTSSFTFIDTDGFSSCTRLLRSTKIALCFLRKVHKSAPTWLKQSSNQGMVIAEDHLIARNYHLRQVQSYAPFSKDIIRKDETGLRRSDCCLSKTAIPRTEKHPIFLPQNYRLTRLPILHEDMSVFHGGALAILSRLRQRFWIPHGRRAVRLFIINHCLQC